MNKEKAQIRVTMRVYNHADSERTSREIARLEGHVSTTPYFAPISTKVI